MEQMPQDLYPIALTVVLIMLSAAAGIIGYFLKDIRGTLKEKMAEQDEAIDKVRDDLAEFKASMPRNYVMRDDSLFKKSLLRQIKREI